MCIFTETPCSSRDAYKKAMERAFKWLLLVRKWDILLQNKILSYDRLLQIDFEKVDNILCDLLKRGIIVVAINESRNHMISFFHIDKSNINDDNNKDSFDVYFLK